MSTQDYPPQRRGMTFGDFITYLILLIIAGMALLLIAIQLGWVPPLLLGPGLNAQTMDAPRPTIQVAPAQYRPPAQPADQPQVQPAAPVVVPSEHVIEFQPLPPPDVEREDVQPRTEVVTVQRESEQTTIVRTVPNKPSGPPIVIDKGRKCMGVCR